MLAPDEKLKLSTRPYLAATARFASGVDSPRDFLERCLADLAALEPQDRRLRASQPGRRARGGRPGNRALA